MKKSLILWLLWLLGAFAAHVFTGTKLTLVLLILSLLIPISTYIITLVAVRGVKISVTLPFVMQKNAGQACVLQVSNHSLLPVWQVKCELAVENLLTGEVCLSPVRLSLMPRSQKEISLKIDSRHCGRLHIAVRELFAFDVFALLKARGTAGAPAKTTVFPDTFPSEVTVSLSHTQLEDCEEYSQLKAGWDRTETFQIRDYVEGDSINQIHWKLTTKYDRLIVRDPALPVLRSLLVFWEKSMSAAETPPAPALSDAMGEAFVSVCQSLVSQSIPFHIAYNDPKTGMIETFEIHDLDSLSRAVYRLLAIPAAPGAASAGELYDKLMEKRSYSAIAYFTHYLPDSVYKIASRGKMTALICAEADDAPVADNFGIISFSPVSYAEDLFVVPL